MSQTGKNKKEIAEKIRRIRVNTADATQSEFAKELGITRSYVAILENPEEPRYPSTALLKKIARTYEIQESYLLSDGNEEEWIDPDMIQAMGAMELQVLYQLEEDITDEASLIPSARVFYQIFTQELKKLLRPETRNRNEQEDFLEQFTTLYHPLLETVSSVKEQMQTGEDHCSELYEIYLQKIAKQQNSSFQQEEKPASPKKELPEAEERFQHFSGRLRYVRKGVAKQTQAAFAKTLSVSRGYINRLENKKYTIRPNIEFMEQICRLYDISIEWLRYGKSPIRQSDAEKYPRIMDIEQENQIIQEERLYGPELLTNHICSELELTLRVLLYPGKLTPRAYGTLMGIYTTLTRPLFQYIEQISKTNPTDQQALQEAYDAYCKDSALAIQFGLK